MTVAPPLAFQFEIFDVGFLSDVSRFIDQGPLNPETDRVRINFCLGYGGLPATPRHLGLIADEGQRQFPNALWGAVTPAVNHFAFAASGAALGADVSRTGFEDTTQLPNGETAGANARRVEALVKIIRNSGRDIASPDEARRMLKIE